MRATATLSATTARVTHVCNTRDPTGNARRTPASLRRAREGHAPRIARLGARIVHAMVDDDAPELPDYDVVTLGPLEGSAIALSARDWTGGSDDANCYVAAIDRGYVLIAASTSSELKLMKEYQGYWSMSEAAALSGVRPPVVYSIVDVDAAESVKDAAQALVAAANGAEHDVLCISSKNSDAKALANGVKAAWELGACPGTVAVDGFDAARLEEFVEALKDTPGIQVAFNRVPYSLADRTFETNGTLAACKRLGVGVVASSPLGEGSRVTNTTHAECDQALVRLLAFLGAMVGGGVQRSPLQVSLNYVMSKGLVPEIETRMGSLAWECGGSMLWRLDENAIGILDERCEAVEKGETGDGGGPALA